MVLYIDDQETNLLLFEAQYADLFSIRTAKSTEEAYKLMKQYDFKVLITDEKMPSENGIHFINRIKDEFPEIIYMVLTAYDETNITRDAINSGMIYRFVLKPWNMHRLKKDIMNAIESYDLKQHNKRLLKDLQARNEALQLAQQQLKSENMYLKSEIKQVKNFDNIISEDPEFLNILNQISMIADSDAPVLITGETGTGKELIARAVHNLSPRRNHPLISINCAAIPETLIESELFGHEKGAFTGATQQKKGRFELAQNGTLFLDEIGEFPINLQPKLLRALQENSIERLGAQKTVQLNVRIVCATNRELKDEINNGNFRSDLYYRINVLNVKLPPLRERRRDIPLLCHHFIDKYNRKYKKKITRISYTQMKMLQAYQWPGNIRELENIIERSVIISDSEKLKLELEHSLTGDSKDVPDWPDKLSDMECMHIRRVLESTNWRIGGKYGAAEILGLNRTTLLARMKKLEIIKPS